MIKSLSYMITYHCILFPSKTQMILNDSDDLIYFVIQGYIYIYIRSSVSWHRNVHEPNAPQFTNLIVLIYRWNGKFLTPISCHGHYKTSVTMSSLFLFSVYSIAYEPRVKSQEDHTYKWLYLSLTLFKIMCHDWECMPF